MPRLNSTSVIKSRFAEVGFWLALIAMGYCISHIVGAFVFAMIPDTLYYNPAHTFWEHVWMFLTYQGHPPLYSYHQYEFSDMLKGTLLYDFLGFFAGMFASVIGVGIYHFFGWLFIKDFEGPYSENSNDMTAPKTTGTPGQPVAVAKSGKQHAGIEASSPTVVVCSNENCTCTNHLQSTNKQFDKEKQTWVTPPMCFNRSCACVEHKSADGKTDDTTFAVLQQR